MKSGLKVFLILFTVVAILLSLFVTTIFFNDNKPYFKVTLENYRFRPGSGVNYFYVNENGYNLAMRLKTDGTGTLHLNVNDTALGSVPVSDFNLISNSRMEIFIENNGLNVMKIVDIINYHFQNTFPSLPEFDFDGGFFSDLLNVVTGIFDVIFYPFEVSFYIINSLVGGFKLFGGGFNL